MQQEGITAFEVDVSRLPAQTDTLLAEVLDKVKRAHADGKTSLIYTSRVERQFPDQPSRLLFGVQVSNFLMNVVLGLPVTTGFIISKGGITSNDMLSKGLTLTTSRIVGQILAGCSVVLTPPEHRLAQIPVVIFPGNVGDQNDLLTVYRRLISK